MCGIAGILSLDGQRDLRGNIQKMADILTHRGPDDSGILVDGQVNFGFRRLSILDLEQTGHQPMTSIDGSCTIIFNGEIYNFVELREKLEARGYRFRSTGDTEVLLNAYCEWGEDCLPMLNGMWAFLIYDRRRKLVFGSRDRFGIKPLFVHRGKCEILFASEIKSIRASGLYQTSVDWSTAADFLVRQKLDTRNETFYGGIEHIPAGSSFILDLDGRLKLRSFWSLPAPGARAEADVINTYAELFEDSVRLHRRSDVPVAVFLSGGIDSTSILCSLARNRAVSPTGSYERLKALAFMDPRFDESRFIDDTITQTSAELERVEYSSQHIWEDLPKVLWYHDEPVHSTTALIGYRLSEAAAAGGIKVILNGQGADETGAGYRRYFQGYWHTLLATAGPRALVSELKSYTGHWNGSAARIFFQILSRAMAAQPYRLALYQDMRNQLELHQNRRHPWFTGDLLGKLPPAGNGSIDRLHLDRQLRESVERSPLPLYLRIEDRNAMASSVEIRVPFLDYRLVELLFSAPGEYKMRGPFNKYIIREAMRGRIPDSVRGRQEKMGFPSPAGIWMSELEGNIRDMLASRFASEIGVFNLPRIRRDFDLHCKGERQIGSETFNVLQFLIWHQNNNQNVAEAGA
jgi:asparagine synthase (glutamine-hydrolysing)